MPTDYEGSLGGPPTNQITGASDTTVNESSVTLDPAVRTVGALQVVQDPDPAPQEGEIIFTTNSKFCRAHTKYPYSQRLLPRESWKEALGFKKKEKQFNE